LVVVVARRTPVVVALRLTVEEAALLDEWRGRVPRGTWLRLMFVSEKRRRSRET
jgi:hypothetical protein